MAEKKKKEVGKRTSLNVLPSLYVKIKHAAVDNGITVSELVDQAFRLWLRAN